MRNAVPFLSDPEARVVLKKHCDEVGISIDTIEKLVNAVEEHAGMGRRHGIFGDIDEILRDEVENSRKEASDVS